MKNKIIKKLDTKVKGYEKRKVYSKDIIKKNKMTVKIPKKKIESVFDDDNKFFKGELNKEKRSLFLS